ncbi:TonB-dependent receptor [Terriglobus tenax]|uniref:TonB-dependent receptor n=1 Tax=Terriglobus tenax TaxID=1111115 RepID=UPI0021E04067|nr:TonB-dependent receptor [Terriglobus tenax]
MKRSWLKCVWLLVVLAVSVAAQAQQAGTIHGLVTDPDAAVVPGATITATAGNGKAVTGTSKGDGSYSISNVPAGTYSLTVTMLGFSSFVRTGVRVAAGQSLNLDVKLVVAEANTEVNVTTQTAQVSTDADSNASATVIKDKDLDALSDDPDELQSQLTALAGPAAGPNGGQIYIDGFTGGTLPPKSSIREIRVNQNPFSAQYDKLGFGRVEVLTKPGTDKFRGNASVQGNQKWMNTSNPFSKNQPDYHTFFFFGGLSGPLTKKSSFNANGNYRDIEDNNIISNVPIYARNLSDLSTICAPGALASSGCINGTYTGGAVPHPQKRWQISPRVDFAVTDKNTLTARYGYESSKVENNGIGNFVLNSRGYTSGNNEHTIQISDSQIVSAKVVNETRFEYQRTNATVTAQNVTPAVNVSGGMNTGGSPTGNSNTTDTHIEVQNYTSVALQKHFIRMGGRLRYTKEEAYSIAGQNGTFTYASLNDYISGTLNQYTVSQINQTTVSNSVVDAGLYAEDDWKVRPNLTISGGIRYETQNQINSARDFAPRLSIAWGVPSKSGSPKTVVRAGYGLFYDRFDLAQVMNVTRQNGTNVQTRTIQASTTAIPSTCTPSNPTACPTQASGLITKYTIGDTRSGYIMQFAAGVDQQVGKSISISANYLNARGVHQYMTRAFTTASNYDYRYDSGGVFNQNQLFVNGTARVGSKFTLFGFYALGFAKGNTGGATFTTSRTYDTKADYGRTSFDVRNRGLLAGSFNFKYAITASPFVMINSGSPFSVTAGQDINVDSVYNDRPMWTSAGSASLAGACSTAAGQNFVTNSDGSRSNAYYTIPKTGTTNYQQIPINSCEGPRFFSFNLRLAKTFGFGERTGGAAGQNGRQRQQGGMMPPPGGGGGGGRGGPGGGGPGGGGPFGGASSGHKYTMTLAAQGSNLFNVVNYGAPVGTLSSPVFGQSNAINAGGGSSNAVRRITLQLNFNF